MVTGRAMWDNSELSAEFIDLITAPADAAIASGDVVYAGGVYEGYWLVVAPDTRVLELAANGHTIPRVYRLARSDGRSVSLFRCPMGGDL